MGFFVSCWGRFETTEKLSSGDRFLDSTCGKLQAESKNLFPGLNFSVASKRPK